MKKLLLLALTTVMMTGCTPIIQKDYVSKEGLEICTIDSCEYIRYFGPEYTHKGNCRFCAERRKQELKELVEQLKEK